VNWAFFHLRTAAAGVLLVASQAKTLKTRCWLAVLQAGWPLEADLARARRGGAVASKCLILGRLVEIGPEALVAAILITKGAQLLVIQNDKGTSADLPSPCGTDLLEWSPI